MTKRKAWDKPLKIKILWNSKGLEAIVNREAGGGPLGQSMVVREIDRGMGVRISSNLPYAWIQDRGGVIPPFQSEGVMRFEVAGEVIFTRSRAQIVIKPKNYIDRAVSKWIKSVTLEWKK